MDEYLADVIVRLGVPQFGPSEKNKGDSTSCRFEPRHLLSSPEALRYIGQRFAEIVNRDCTGAALVGLATSGIAWAALASVYCELPMLYIRKAPEPGVSEKLLEGIPPSDGSMVLIDDLLFHGHSKRKAIKSLRDMGLRVSDVVVIIDRQLQRKLDGPPLQQDCDLRLHSMISMDEIVRHMQATSNISDDQLDRLIRDYRSYDRWDLPEFAREGVRG
jgi:uridine monophosphate synthetase